MDNFIGQYVLYRQHIWFVTQRLTTIHYQEGDEVLYELRDLDDDGHYIRVSSKYLKLY